ncbi:exportin-2 [Plutella xylostella]|uniref:exportin-2 n=1 Tax=Plutella xylostella TaxID=51655 RepID=UPI0020328FF5|nr:exportin-2 [Plutella xylostella]
MEVTDENLATLANYLQQTLNPDPNIRRPAEKFLEGVEVNQNYAILLLHLIDKDAVDQTIRVAAAIVFKNYIKRNWPVDEDGVDRIHSSDRATIKTLIVTLMLKSPESIQRQFSDAVSIIGKCDFPDKWPSLIPEMVEKFNTGDFHVINGVLRTAHSLFKRYRYEFKSQRLWEEIKHVLDNFAKPLTDLFVATIDLASKHADNPQALRVIYGSLVLICKVFYSLNCQDLPEFFEDNMGIWMPNLLNLLQVKVPCLEDPQEDEKPGVLEQLRTEICECCALYALKYEEEFTAHAPPFVTAAWGVLLATTPQTKYDALVSNGLNFLAKIAEKNIYKNLFEDPATLSSICEKVVIPNIEFRESDMELFEDNPEEYVRRDIEGSDVDTRRRAACDLVKTLSVHFEANMMAIFGQYVQLMLQKYSAEGAAAWRCKDTALYLVTSLAARGATQAAGVTRASPLVDLAQFAQTNVVTELQGAETQLPVIRADAMKYLMTFRSLLPKELLVSTIPLLINHIKVPGVVCTYAACTIEKLIGGGVATREHIEPHAASLLAELLQAIEPTHNEYVMKAFLRTVTCLGDASLQYLGAALPALARLLAQVAKNPSKPHFNHYLFETLSLSVKLVTKANPSAVSAFEDALFPIFQEILQNDVQEFMPYVFQMLSLLLELGGGAGASGGAYRALWGSVVAPPLWERAGHVRALVRLLCALVAHDTQAVREKGRLSAVLGVFQKLIASKTNDHEGFYLVQTLLYKLGMQDLEPYIKQIMTLLFQRLSSSKTTKYVKGLIAFLGFFAAHFGADNLIEIVESVQPNMFSMYVQRILIPDIQKVSGALERKAAAVGCVKLLCESAAFRGPLAPMWTPLMQALISVFELPCDESSLPDDHFVEVDDAPGYQAAYSQLSCAKPPSQDPLESISSPQQYLAESLGAMARSNPGLLPQKLSELEEPHRAALQMYLNKYSVQVC